MDASIYGSPRYGFLRYGVTNDRWEGISTTVEDGGLGIEVTRLQLMLSYNRDSWSGWKYKSYSESTICGVMTPKGQAINFMNAGVFIREDYGFTTLDPLNHMDQIKWGPYYFEVGSVQNFYDQDGGFAFRITQLTGLPLYKAEFGETTWSKTRPQDARQRTKTWMDTYLRSSQITKNDDVALARYAVIFNNPPYLIEHEFMGDSRVNGLYVVDQPNSTALRDGDQIIRDYMDSVPIHIVTVDSEDCSGDALRHKMVDELQYISENHPEGSQRNLERKRKNDQELGGMKLYDTEYTLTYVRTSAT